MQPTNPSVSPIKSELSTAGSFFNIGKNEAIGNVLPRIEILLWGRKFFKRKHRSCTKSSHLCSSITCNYINVKSYLCNHS